MIKNGIPTLVTNFFMSLFSHTHVHADSERAAVAEGM